MGQQGPNSAPNPLQSKGPHQPEHGWFGRIIGAVVYACLYQGQLVYRKEAGAPFQIKLTQWPTWLERVIRREIVKAAREHANYVIAAQARKIVDLEREIERLKAKPKATFDNHDGFGPEPLDPPHA